MRDPIPHTARLAVIITCFNYEAFVAQAIRSVLAQGRGDCELVVVDDGSTDGSWGVIERLGITAFRIANCGQRAACLFGLEQTHAPFVLFLDADDELRPGALDTILGRLDPAVAKLQFPLVPIDADGKVIGGLRPSLQAFRDKEAIARNVLKSCVYLTPPTSGNVFRRDVCDLLREAAYDRAVDGVILVAAPFFGDIVSLEEPLGLYRIHDRNESGIGRRVDVATMQRDADRFIQRTEHLRAVIATRRVIGRLARAEDAFYLRDLRFCIDVLSGRKHPIASLWRLLYTLAIDPDASKNRPAYAAFICVAAILPRQAAKTLVAYRHASGTRSPRGLLRQLFGKAESLGPSGLAA